MVQGRTARTWCLLLECSYGPFVNFTHFVRPIVPWLVTLLILQAISFSKFISRPVHIRPEAGLNDKSYFLSLLYCFVLSIKIIMIVNIIKDLIKLDLSPVIKILNGTKNKNILKKIFDLNYKFLFKK